MEKLPLELLSRIFEFSSCQPPNSHGGRYEYPSWPSTSQSTGAALCLVCKTWNKLSTPFLYTHPLLSTLPYQRSFLLRTVKKRRDLARLVRGMAMYLPHWPGVAREGEYKEKLDSEEILKLIRICPNFVRFKMRGGRMDFVQLLAAAPLLEYLDLQGVIVTSNAGSTFLMSHPLQKLRIHGGTSLDPHSHLSISLPKLHTLSYQPYGGNYPWTLISMHDSAFCESLQSLVNLEIYPIKYECGIRTLLHSTLNGKFQNVSLHMEGDIEPNVPTVSTVLELINSATIDCLTLHEVYGTNEVEGLLAQEYPALSELKQLKFHLDSKWITKDPESTARDALGEVLASKCELYECTFAGFVSGDDYFWEKFAPEGSLLV